MRYASTTTEAPPRLVDRMPAAAVIGLAVCSGALITTQARINGRLSDRLDAGTAHTLGHSVLAALISFGTGLIVALVVVAARRTSRQGLRRLSAVPWRQRIGGFGLGAAQVTAQAVAVPVIGLSLFTVSLVSGQTAGGLAVDGIGLGPSGRHHLSFGRVAGAALTVVAVAIAASGHGSGGVAIGAVLFVVFAGVLVACREALNGRVNVVTGDAWVSSLVNFAAGTFVLALAALACLGLGQLRTVQLPTQWWLYLGGTCGVVFIAINSATVRRLGVLGLVVAAVSGQVASSLAYDIWWPAAHATVNAGTVVGTLLTLVAVLIVSWSGRSAESPELA